MGNRCAYLDKYHVFRLREEPVPKPGTGEVLIQIAVNGICGSDIHFYREGKLGNFIVTQPYIPGHEASGTIVDRGPEVKELKTGDRVVVEPGIPCGRCSFCKTGRYNLCREVVFLSAPPVNGTFCSYVTLRADCVHKIPEGLSFEEAALAEPAAVAVHAVNRAGVRNGDTAAIIGAGPIGLLTLQAFKAAGGKRVVCLDVLDSRLELASRLGADETVNVRRAGDLSDLAEVVFETAGAPGATAALFRYASAGGRAVQVGWPAGNQVSMNIADFLDKELDYIGVNRYANAFPAAIAWIADGRIKGKELITHRFGLDEIGEAFRFTSENPEQVVKTIVHC